MYGPYAPEAANHIAEWVSYMLPAKEYQRGGYEATISFYGETLGPTVVEAVVKNAAAVK